MKIHGKHQKIFKLTVEFLLIPFLLTACGDSKTTSQQSADDKNFFEKIFSTEKNSPADFLKRKNIFPRSTAYFF